MRRWLLPIALGLALAPNALAQSDCSDGIIYDDGSFEDGDGLNPTSVARGGWLQYSEAPSYPSQLKSVCLCWFRTGASDTVHFDLGVWDATGGQIGALLGTVPNLQAANIPLFAGGTSGNFFRYDISASNIVVNGPFVVGPLWEPGTDAKFYECSDKTPGSNKLRLEYLSSSSSTNSTGTPTGPANAVTGTYALGIRTVLGPPAPPPPPPPPPDPPVGIPGLTTTEFPGFLFWVRVSDTRIGTAVADCLPETECIAASIPTRAEVFVRIVGPKSNGYLWPNIVKFNTTKTEVWIRQVSTGKTQYYLLPALAVDSSTLPGIVDKTGFLP